VLALRRAAVRARRLWRREDTAPDLGDELRAFRPQPRSEFVRALTSRIEKPTVAQQYGGPIRLGFAGGLTAALLAALGSFGGLGYAATGTQNEVNAIERVARQQGPTVVRNSAAQDQYEPKVTICHRTGSKKHPFVTITVAEKRRPRPSGPRRHAWTL
jgi:hypothetical protein